MLNLRNIASGRQNITSAVKYLLAGLILFSLSSFCPNPKKHPYYIGLTEITCKTGSDIRISIRLFANDLEEALRKSSGKPVDILHPKNKPETDSLLFHYLSKRLSLAFNGKALAPVYLGYEQEEESIWTYMEIRQARQVPLKTLTVTNTILYDYFPSQTHIIRVNYHAVSESKKISNPDSKAAFSF